MGRCCCFACAASIHAQSGSAAPVLPLEDAVTLARQKNRSLKHARLAVERAREQWSAARTRKLPLLDVKAASGSLVAPLDFRFSSGVFGVSPGLGPIPVRDTVIRTDPRLTAILIASVTQPLTQLPRIEAGVQVARLAVDVAAEEARAREADIVAAARADTGTIAWQSGDFENGYSSPVVIDLDGRPEVVVFTAAEIAGIDPKTGAVEWTRPHPADYGVNVAMPLWGTDNLLFVSSAYNGVLCGRDVP